MVKSTRSSQKAKDEENNNGRVTRSSEKAKIKAHPNVSDTAGIRKSSREKPSKIIATSSSTQKSEQVEKGTLPAPETRRKSLRVEKMKTPSPLTRSGKTRNHSFSGPSDSKSAGSLGSISRQKLQKEKSVKHLTFEAKEVNENEEHNRESSQVKRKKMTALMYRSLFTQPKKDCLGNSDNNSKSNQEGDNSSGAKIDELSKGSCSDNKEVSKNGTLPSEDATAKETTVDSRIGDKSKGDNSSGAKIDELSKGSYSDNEEVSKNGTLPFKDGKAKETRVDSRTDEPRCQSKGDNSSGAKIDELSKGSCSDNDEVSKNGTLPFEDGKAKETRIDSRTDEPRCQSKADNSIGAKIDELSKGSCSDNKEVSKNGTLTSEDAKAKETRVNSRLSGPMTDLAENCATPGSFIPSNTPTYETSVVPRRVQPDCCGEETLPTLVSGDSVFDDDDLVSNNAGLGGGEKLAPSKRKAITMDIDSNVPSSLSKGDSSNLIPDALPSKLGGNESCSKRIRLDFNPTVEESRDPCATEDIDVIEATMQQKDKSDHASGTGHLKGTTVEDKNIHALLDGQSVVHPKEKVSSHIANRCKSDSYKLVEYWVPVQISNVQLEQYCNTLLSNASFLCSSPKIDSVGAIRDVLISIRKCCNHPYIIEESLQPLLLKGIEEVEYPSQKEKAVAYLNVGIKASSKLQLLDSMLTELRKNKLRALILFQPIGVSGKTSIVDILDDFLRQRFGEDSYERIDNCLTASKKQAATKIFNDKNNKRFFFLMETSACHPSIKLSSIDAIIIFDSDWNPMNDIRSLQKLTLDSQFESIKTFRLYSPFTVEEKALILSRQGKTLDINCPSSSRGLSHTLLMWGAVHLFDELRVFHDGATSTSNLKPLLEETVSQFSSCLADVGEDSDTSNCSILLKVQQHGGAYLANSPLFGELEFRSPDEESPQKFWNNLLVGRQFQWKYSCGSTQRSRRRVQPFNNLAGGTDLVNEGTTKKRLKVSNNNVDQPSSKSVGEKLPNGIKAGTFGDLVDKPQGSDDVESGKNGRVHDELRSLHLSLKPQITKLCEVLLLPDNVRNVVDNFLEYVTNKHHFNWESVSIQSFQISLIRAAASLLNHKVDQKTILALSKEQLNFDCKQAEVDYSYSFLQCLKKIFVYRTGTYNDNSSPKVCKSLNGVSCTEVVQEVELFKKDLSKSIKKIQKKFVKMLNKVRLMYQEEKHRLRVVNEDEKAELERKYKIQLAMTRSCYPNEVVRTETLNILNVDHQKSIEELKCEHETRLKELEDEHSEHIRKYQVWEASWVEEVKSWAKNELLNIVASKGPGTGIDYSQMCDNVVESMIEAGAMVTETNSPSVGKTVKLQNSLVKHDRANEMDILVPNDQLISGSEDHNMTENQYSQENIISKHSHSREQNSDGATSMTDETNRSENFGHESQDGCERSNLGITSLPDYENATHTEHQCSGGVSSGVEGQIPVELQETTDKGDSVSISERQVQVEMPVTDNSTDCQLENATQLNPPSSMDQTSDRVSIDVPVVDGVLSSKPCQAVGLTGCQDKISLSNPPLEQQIPDGDVPVMEPENSHAVAECHMEPSTNAMLVDNSTTDDQEGGVQGNVTSAPVPRPVNVMEPLGQGKELPSVKSAADKNSDGAMQNSSEQVQVASSSADVVPANQITVPSKQVHQLAAAEPSSNLALSGFSTVHLATEDEHQLNSVHSLPTHHSEPTSVVPNKDAGQSHSNSNSALGLHSNQVAVHPISNSDLDLLTASRVRAQSGYRRNLSNPLEMNNHPIQSTPPSSSRRLQHLSYDPLNIEFERIQKVIEQSSKNHEDTKLRLKSDFEKELAELRRKYDVKFQEIEVEFQQTKKTLDTNLNTVYVNKILANAFKSKCLDLKVSGASGVQHDSLPQHLHQLSRQQAATRPFLVSGSSSGESPVTSLPSPSIAPNSQHMLPPGYNMSGTFSSASARPPLINTTRSSIAQDIQGGEIRAPAPHLHSSRPSISAPPSSFNPLQRGIPSQTAASNLRATSPSYAHVSPWQRPPSYQSNPQMGRRPDSAGRSALLGNFSSQSTKTPPNIISRLSDVAPANLSRSGPNSSSVVANSSHQAASQNLVCLSDDE